MNLRVDRGLVSGDAPGWFGNRTMLYGFVPPGGPEVSLGLRLPWWLACVRAWRRLGFYNSCATGRPLASQVRWLDPGPGAVEESTGFVHRLTGGGPGYWSADRTMDSLSIMRDLLGSFLGNGGQLRLGRRAVKIGENEVVTESEVFRARHVVVAAGHESTRLVGLATRVVWSPLLVVWPALNSFNWVRMSPAMGRTLNHVVHKAGGETYSVVGSALYYPGPGDQTSAAAVSALTSRLRGLFTGVDHRRTAIYWGPKTEIVGTSQLRNYQSRIVETGGVTAILPGKLTLSFALAAALCRRFGFEFCGKVGEYGDARYLDQVVEPPRHATVVRSLLISQAA